MQYKCNTNAKKIFLQNTLLHTLTHGFMYLFDSKLFSVREEKKEKEEKREGRKEERKGGGIFLETQTHTRSHTELAQSRTELAH